MHEIEPAAAHQHHEVGERRQVARRMNLPLDADALERLLDPKWGPEPIPMLYEIARLGCRFLVIERGESTLAGVLDRARVPNELRYAGHLFATVPGRWDMSSTELRSAG